MHTKAMINNMTLEEKLKYGYPLKEEDYENLDIVIQLKEQVENLQQELEEAQLDIKELTTNISNYRNRLEEISNLANYED